MIFDLRYLGKSGIKDVAGGSAMTFAPNLARPRVFFDAELKNPVRYREAMSALHDVVVGDLRFKKKDKTAYAAWKAQQDQQDAQLRAQVLKSATEHELKNLSKEPIPANLEVDFRKMHDIYWTARRQWARELSQNDPDLFRHLVPCDPVVTVAPDVVFFECFAKDESSYGCLTVDRDAFKGSQDAGLGTTNVDYSLALYDHVQTLRSYRATRLQVDPTGFEVKVEGREDYREEKIDLPPSWLKGFGQIQAAMGLPSRKVTLSVDVVYSLLAFMKRHREKTGPRSLKFQLVPGRAPVVVVEPWNVSIPSHGPVYQGEKAEEIKVWGRRRLMTLARVLPLADKFEVVLLGTGLPSMWVAHCGELRFTLALSGWTTNDWTSGSNLDLLAGLDRPDNAALLKTAAHLEKAQKDALDGIVRATGLTRESAASSLYQLARQGQAIYDVGSGTYRYRQVMPVALSETLLGPEHPEAIAGRRAFVEKQVKIERDEPLSATKRFVQAKVDGTPCEAVLDADLLFSKGKCSCGHFSRNGLRQGPCRHLFALRLFARGLPEQPAQSATHAPSKLLETIKSAVAGIRPTRDEQAAPTDVSASRKQSLFFPAEMLEEIEETATRRDRSLSMILREAWTAALPIIKAAPDLATARAAVKPGPKSGEGEPQKMALFLPEAMLSELGDQANRFDLSLSATLQLAWTIAREDVKRRS